MLIFENDGPQISIKGSDRESLKITRQKVAAARMKRRGIQTFMAFVMGLYLLVLVIADSRLWQQIILGTGFAIGAFTIFFYKKESDPTSVEQSFFRQQTWADDEGVMKKLPSKKLELSPPTPNGFGKLRIFYQDSNGMLCVWYSKGIYRYQTGAEEGCLDFVKGIVQIPNSVFVPSFDGYKINTEKGVLS